MTPDTPDREEPLSSDRREFTEAHGAVAFPLGGIGTGNVSLGARGDLRDWELFNQPGKGNELPYAFFMLRCAPDGGEAVTRVLEAQREPPYHRWFGYPPGTAAGLPRMDGTSFRGEYPVAEVDFRDEAVPADVSLTAYTPFRPLEPEDSGIPVAVLEYTVSNPTDEPLSASVAGTLPNPAGYVGETEIDHHLGAGPLGGNRNRRRETGALTGLEFTTEKYDPDALRYGEFALAVPETEGVTTKTTWERDGWWDAFREFGEDFREDGRLTEHTADGPSADGRTDVGALAVSKTIPPGESETVTFLLTWFVPNRPYDWDQRVADRETESGDCCGPSEDCCSGESVEDAGGDVVRNYYATRFDGAWDVAERVAADFEDLRAGTFSFRDAFFGSTLPGHVLEAVSSQIAVARSTTCMWFEDGTFLAYEGCRPDAGCCLGNCTHVWNYAQTLARLFPSLEREMRRIDFTESTDEDGFMHFRTSLPFGADLDREDWDELPAVDGQMGTVMRLYREWRYSGDDDFLAELWPDAKRALEFAFEYAEWDPDEDGVLEGQQHNTYDIEFYGPNGMLQSWYLGALKAGAAMARAVGDDAAATRYEDVLESGAKYTDEELFNGEFYVQALDDVDEHRYQYGRGCLSDQLLGQWYAEMLDLGDLLPGAHVRSALDSIYEYNFREGLSEHFNYQRTYALGDERGLVLCSWPNGGEPEYPFVYSDEVWTGIEYQVASHLVYEGRVEAGLDLVHAVRERHDGTRRNPWNEFECGNHYARAMASWAVYDALCGLRVDLREDGDGGVNEHGFEVDPADPVAAAADGTFRCFWITGDAWGVYEDGPDGGIEIRHERRR